MNSCKIFNYGHVRVFCQIQTVTAMFWCFYKSETYGKNPTKYTWWLTLFAKLIVIETWVRISRLEKDLSYMRSCEMLKRKISSWHWGWVLPPKMLDQEHSFPPFYDHPFLNSCTMKVFMILFLNFCLLSLKK